MPYLDSHYTEEQFRNLFQKLLQMELKLDELVSLQAQERATTVHLPLRPEYLDIIDVSKLLKVERKLVNTHFSPLWSKILGQKGL